MAYTYGKPANKHRLKKAFLKATLGVVLLAPAYQAYMPDTAQDWVKHKAMAVVGMEPAKKEVDINNLQIALESPNRPTVLGSSTQGVFNNSGTNMPDEWMAALGRHTLLMQNSDNAAAMDKWLSQLDNLKNKSIAEKAQGVDALVDRTIRYESDVATYGREEHFAAPLETLAKKQGDCDDFAILKYFSLRYLGVPADKMFVVAVGPENTKTLNHATLMVDTRETGVLTYAWDAAKNKAFGTVAPSNFVILDNDGSPDGKLVEARDAKYRPYYAMNEKGIWSVTANTELWQKPQPPKP
jgi:predicted transglutaminase-like cysteine proteinase